VDDTVSEGLHFVNVRHVVTDANGNRILLPDGSALSADEVLVEIHDNDIGGVIVEQTIGYTATAQVNPGIAQGDALPISFYQDSYTIRLSRQPLSNVVVTVSSKAVASDRDYPSTSGLSRDFQKRPRVTVGTSEPAVTSPSIVLTFTPGNWATPQVVHVAAIENALEEGVSLMNFAPQPSYLSYVQGPLILSTTASAVYRSITRPMMMYMLSGEIDDASFGYTPGPFKTISKQKENLEIYNLDLRGVDPSIGTLTENTFTGFDLSSNLAIGGIRQRDGITYEGIEVLEIRLGDGVDVLTVVNVTRATQLLIRTRGENDDLYFKALAPDSIANVYGDDGDDTIWIDGTDNWRQAPVNLLVSTRLRWSGGDGDDTMHIKQSSVGTSDIDIFNDLYGINDVNIDCADSNTVMLSRENFLVNIHDPTNPNSTVERINLIRESDQSELLGFRNTAVINTLVLRLNGGTNIMYFDDTFAPMDIYGGPLVDGKWFENVHKSYLYDDPSYLFPCTEKNWHY